MSPFSPYGPPDEVGSCSSKASCYIRRLGFAPAGVSTTMILSIFTLGALATGSFVVEPVLCIQPRLANPIIGLADVKIPVGATAADVPPNCFPSIGFRMPATTPASLTDWWCNYNTEYAFVGFSTRLLVLGQSLATLQREFLDIRERFAGRYVRIYGFAPI